MQHVAVAHASPAFLNWCVRLQGNNTSNDAVVEPEVTAMPAGPKLNLPFLPPGLTKLRSPCEVGDQHQLDLLMTTP